MAAAASERYTAPPLALPEGHCQRVEDGSPWFWVRGRSGWYLVNSETGECDCGSWVFKCAYRHILCRHGKRLAWYLAELAACPYCRGQGALVPGPEMHYVNVSDGTRDTAAIPCVMCSGSRKREEQR